MFSVARIARWFAAGWAIAAFIALLVLPVYSSITTTMNGTAVRGSATLLSVNGPRVLFVLAVPVLASLLAIIPAPSRVQRVLAIAAAAIASGFVLLGAMTVGVFFLPTALALILAALSPGTPREPAT
jgi:hypothetical protein